MYTFVLYSYLHCVMNEVHRADNLGPFAARYSDRDLTLRGYLVPARVSP